MAAGLDLSLGASSDDENAPLNRVACWLPLMRSLSSQPKTSVIRDAVWDRRSA